MLTNFEKAYYQLMIIFLATKELRMSKIKDSITEEEWNRRELEEEQENRCEPDFETLEEEN